MTDAQVYELFLERINEQIDLSLIEVMERTNLTAEEVIEKYKLEIKKALYVSRSQL